MHKTRLEEVAKQLLTAMEINADLIKKIENSTVLHTSDTAEIANNALLEATKLHAEWASAKEQIAGIKDSDAVLHKQLEELSATYAVENEKAKIQIEILENNIKNDQAKRTMI